MKARQMNGRNGNGAPRPVHRITRGKIECAIWERQGKTGRFFQASVQRTYEAKDGTFGSSPNLGLSDLGDAIYALVAAGLWMEAQRKPRRDDDYSSEGTEPEFEADVTESEFY